MILNLRAGYLLDYGLEERQIVLFGSMHYNPFGAVVHTAQPTVALHLN